jgi:hypothetical protein
VIVPCASSYVPVPPMIRKDGIGIAGPERVLSRNHASRQVVVGVSCIQENRLRVWRRRRKYPHNGKAGDQAASLRAEQLASLGGGLE